MSKHTPTPWRLKTSGNIGCAIEADSGRRSEMYEDDGFRIVATYQECTGSQNLFEQRANCDANGRFIVKAVNAHDDLVNALRGMVDLYVGLVESGDAGFWDAEKVEEVVAARKALA